MAGEWLEVDGEQLVRHWAARVTSVGGSVELTDAISVLLVVPATIDVLKVEGNGTDGFNQFVPHTRIFFNPTKAKEISWDAITALSVYATTGSVSLATAVGIAQRALRTFKILGEDEMDVVLVMRGCCGDRDPTVTSITLAELESVYAGTSMDLGQKLGSLEKTGAVTRGESGWRLTL